MQRINTAYFYKLATKLIPLRNVSAGKPLLEVFGDLYGADEELRFFLSQDVMPPITSFNPGKTLLACIIREAVEEWFWGGECRRRCSRQRDIGCRPYW